MDKKRILFVDDNPATLELFTIRFESNDYEVITAVDGEEALARVKDSNPHLLVLDIMLPKINGYKVCGMMKNDVRFAHIPVILFSATNSDEGIKIAEEVECDGFIVKDSPSEVLLDKIKELLSVDETSAP